MWKKECAVEIKAQDTLVPSLISSVRVNRLNRSNKFAVRLLEPFAGPNPSVRKLESLTEREKRARRGYMGFSGHKLDRRAGRKSWWYANSSSTCSWKKSRVTNPNWSDSILEVPKGRRALFVAAVRCAPETFITSTLGIANGTEPMPPFSTLWFRARWWIYCAVNTPHINRHG